MAYFAHKVVKAKTARKPLPSSSSIKSKVSRVSKALNRTADFETVRQIKEKLCYVSYDLELDQRLSEDTTVLVSVRVATSAYGLHLLGKVLLPETDQQYFMFRAFIAGDSDTAKLNINVGEHEFESDTIGAIGIKVGLIGQPEDDSNEDYFAKLRAARANRYTPDEEPPQFRGSALGRLSILIRGVLGLTETYGADLSCPTI
ncbi:hypothetical protein NHQ30_011332 [Ciborinia camelliae]|nr:hypothetical protein NHQ30_011332 [Ciborinia camelliae]